MQLTVERKVLVGAAVMRDLHDVVPGSECIRCRERPLGSRTQVTQKQRSKAPELHVKHDARAIAFAVGMPSCPGPEHAPACPANAPVFARARLASDRAAGFERGDEAPLGCLDRRPVQHSAHSSHHRVDATNMVEIEVREYEQIDSGDAEPRKARGDGCGLGPHIDQRDLATRAHQHRIG